jgi:osmotically inducible protein OsmC
MAKAEWKGTLKEGQGRMSLGSGAYEGAYSFGSRFEEQPGTNPEELLGAAFAGCYSMALAAGLGKAGFTPERVHTTARVHLEKVGEGFSVTRIELQTEGQVPGLDEKTFLEHAERTKTTCPISRALNVPEVKLEARLLQPK